MRKLIILIGLAGCLSACGPASLNSETGIQPGEESTAEMLTTEQPDESGSDIVATDELPDQIEYPTVIVIPELGYNGQVFISEDI